MPAHWPETAGAPPAAPDTAPVEAGPGPEPGAPGEPTEPGLRFPWMPEPGAEPEEPRDEGWNPPTMDPLVEDAEAATSEEVPPPDEIVGTPVPEPSPVTDAPGTQPEGPALPAVAPSAMPPADSPLAEGPAAEAAPTAAQAAPTGPSTTAGTGAPGPEDAGPGAGAGQQGDRADWPAGQPVWDPARAAYIYWDPAKDEWLQFDYRTGAWGPISRAG
ncbi:MAG: hypothetical protein GEV08_25150 [Acidimicrobiia bacterium]|nr:hypothetical protein [Acidimicrobiia bacterium]